MDTKCYPSSPQQPATIQNNKLVGARKRKPMNISKIVEKSRPGLESILDNLRDSKIAFNYYKCGVCFELVGNDLLYLHMRGHQHFGQVIQCRLCLSVFNGSAPCESHLLKGHGLVINNNLTDLKSLMNVIELDEVCDSQEEPLDLSVDAVDLSTNKPIKKEPAPFLNYGESYKESQAAPIYIQQQLQQRLSLSPFCPEEIEPRPVEQLEKKIVQKIVHSKKESNKPKQRRYRTERPFACPHCPARFTLRSNMERHGKHQHGSVWQRSPSNRVLNKQKLLEKKPNPNETKSSFDIRSVLNNKLKRKLSATTTNSNSEEENNTEDLVSVEDLIQQSVRNQNLLGSVDEGDDVDMDDPGDEGEGDEEEESEESDSEEEQKSNKKTSAYSSAPHKISCPHCSRRFPWTSSLRRHLLTHTGQKPYQCSKCPLLFTTKSNCDRHLARKHNSENNEEEDDGDEEEEGVIFKSGDDEEEESSEMPQFRCHLCDCQSVSRSKLLTHMSISHSKIHAELLAKGALTDLNTSDEEGIKKKNNRKVLCTFCLRRFWSVEDLRRHIRSHSGEKPFSCLHCQRKFTLKHSMVRHQRKHL